MSDVERGGSTVFTNIGQAVQPKKVSLTFYFGELFLQLTNHVIHPFE